MEFAKGRPPRASTKGEIEFVRAFHQEHFGALGIVVASGTSHWSNRKGSKGHDYAWILARVQGFAEPLYVKTARGNSVAPMQRGENVNLVITPEHREDGRQAGNWFNVTEGTRATQQWEDALDLL